MDTTANPHAPILHTSGVLVALLIVLQLGGVHGQGPDRQSSSVPPGLAAADWAAIPATLLPGVHTSFTASTSGAGDHFRVAAAVDGTTVVIGAAVEDSAATDAGAAYGFAFVPVLAVADASILEDDGRTRTAMITATLSQPSSQQVTVEYVTIDGTATPSIDYMATSGTLTFAPGQTTQLISIPVIDDLRDEPNETFGVAISQPVNAILGDNEAIVTIIDDDELPTNTPTPTDTPTNTPTSTPHAVYLVPMLRSAPFPITSPARPSQCAR